MKDVDIWVCNTQLRVNIQTARDSAHRNNSVTAKYVGDVPMQVTYTKSSQTPDGTKVYPTSNVEGFHNPGTYHTWCRAYS